MARPLALPPRALLDGGMGTALIARGLELGREPPELWNLHRPADVREVHRAFVAAGSQLIQTNTFGGNRLRLRLVDQQGAVAAINRRAVELAREEAVGAQVVGSIGPSGLLPPPQGDADLLELEDAFAEQAAALAGAGVDFLHLETFYHPKELRAALRGARAGARGVPVVGSFTCSWTAGSGPIGDRQLRTPSGFPIDAMIQVLVEEHADGVGACCSLPPAAMAAVVTRLAVRTTAPIFAQPLPASERGGAPAAAVFAADASALFAAGAACVGGCCGTAPADVAALRAAL